MTPTALMDIVLSDPNPIGAARWQLAYALGRLDAMRKYPDIIDLESLAEELEATLRFIKKAHNGDPA
jgi:hypothetical protein